MCGDEKLKYSNELLKYCRMTIDRLFSVVVLNIWKCFSIVVTCCEHQNDIHINLYTYITKYGEHEIVAKNYVLQKCGKHSHGNGKYVRNSDSVTKQMKMSLVCINL